MNRPPSVTFFSVFNIIIAVVGVVFIAMSVRTLLQVYEVIPLPEEIDSPVGFTPREIVLLIKDNPAYLALNWVSLVWMLIKTIVLLSASIGMLKLLPWARIATLVVGGLSIPFNLVNGVVSHKLVTVPMLEKVSEMGNEQITTAIGFGIKIGFALQAVPLVYTALMIFVLTRRSVVGAFATDDLQSDASAEAVDANERTTL